MDDRQLLADCCLSAPKAAGVGITGYKPEMVQT